MTWSRIAKPREGAQEKEEDDPPAPLILVPFSPSTWLLATNSLLGHHRPKGAKSSQKPRPDFPLFPHASGRWAKKVLGKFAYFGKVEDDPLGQAALDLWLEQRDELLAGRKPRGKGGDYLSIARLCDAFIDWKQQLLDSGELAQRTYDQYYEVCKLVTQHFGRNRPADDIRPEDFQALRAVMSKRWGPVRLGNQIQFIRSIFKFGAEEHLLERPVSFGKTFKKPAAKTIRRIRSEKGPQLFTPEQIQALLKLLAQLEGDDPSGHQRRHGQHGCSHAPVERRRC